jgi:hypothetical protein
MTCGRPLNSPNLEIQRCKRSIPSHSQSKWLRGVRHQSGLLGLWVQIQVGHECVSLVSVVHCQVQVSLLGCSLDQRNRNECDGVSECDCEALIMRRPWPTRCCCTATENLLSSLKTCSNFDLRQLHYFTYHSPIFTVIFSILMYY